MAARFRRDGLAEGPFAKQISFEPFEFVRPRERQFGQASGALTASHFANAALTSIGLSWAIQWPEGTTTSVRSAQSRRIGSARRESIVSQVQSYAPCRKRTGRVSLPAVFVR